MADQFTTSYGTTIRFVPGYRQSHRRRWKFSTYIAGVSRPRKTRTGSGEMFWHQFSYGMLGDFLSRLGLWGRRYERALDVGGAQGIVAALLRADGRARHVSVVDIVDYSRHFSPLVHALCHLKLRLEVWASKWLPLLPKSWHVFRKNDNKYGYVTTFGSQVWNVRWRRAAKVDDYLVGDFSTFPFRGKFDLIVSVNAIEYLDFEGFLRRSSELLEPGGVCCFLVNYWWYPVNSTTIYGDFPYAGQRLTRADLRRYFEENHPAEAAAMEEQYGYFHKGRQPVVEDYIRVAEACGLAFAGSERLMPQPWSKDLRTPLVPAELHRLPGFSFAQVLEDIHRFRPEVTLEDLHTSHVLLAFVKRGAAA